MSSKSSHNKEKDFYIGQSLENHERWHYLQELEQRKQDLIREELMRPITLGDLKKSNSLHLSIYATIIAVIATTWIVITDSTLVMIFSLLFALTYLWLAFKSLKKADIIDKMMKEVRQ